MKPENNAAGQTDRPLRVAVVGPCAAGKTMVVEALRAAGYEARHVAQEHSYVLNMWQRVSRPDRLVFLDVNYENSQRRRPHLDGGPERLNEQRRRLAHARQHCDLYVDTNPLAPADVLARVLGYLHSQT